MLRVEFHCHTNASIDSLISAQKLIDRCRKIGIDRVVVTDHNSIAGALRAKEIAPDLIIIGEEIRTRKGELLAAFVKEEIPKDLAPREAIERLRKQHAFISVSHPFDTLRSGAWTYDDLIDIVPFVDAIEIFNSRCLFETFNAEAREFAERHSMAGTVGSDAHTLPEIGRASMLLNDFSDAESFKNALESADFKLKRSGLLARLGSRYAALRNRVKARPLA
jgi:predicted metal-dependent phosphoesterase TrpH